MEFDKEVKQIELNDIRNILDEKLRENSSLKKEKMYFIEKLAEFERERQEQQTIIQISPKQSSPDREKSPASIKIKTIEQNVSQSLRSVPKSGRGQRYLSNIDQKNRISED